MFWHCCGADHRAAVQSGLPEAGFFLSEGEGGWFSCYGRRGEPGRVGLCAELRLRGWCLEIREPSVGGCGHGVVGGLAAQGARVGVRLVDARDAAPTGLGQ